LLRELARDNDSTVAEAAILGLSEGIEGMLEIGLLDEALSSIEFVRDLPIATVGRGQAVEAAGYAIQYLKARSARATTVGRKQELDSLIERAGKLFEGMTDGDFRSRFVHWLRCWQ